MLRLAAVLLSALLLSPGWLGVSGLTLPVALVPLLWISSSYGSSRREWWAVFGWAALAFTLWNAATIWWIWYATPVGPFAATLASVTLNILAFMLFHTVSKKAHKALAYTLLVSAWIATEYWYTTGDFSWPWLLLGNGFSHEVWAVQWYEYTGIFGGTLWVLVSNITIFEALRARSVRRGIAAAAVVVLPIALSLTIWFTWQQPDLGTARVSIIQPNVDAYEKFNGNSRAQEQNILDLLGEVPRDAQFIALPETALPQDYWEPELAEAPILNQLADSLRATHPQALLITGANILRYYKSGIQTPTARRYPYGDGYFDRYNTALGLDSANRTQLHHKGRLVIGVENTPTWVFKAFNFLVIDLGGYVGQLGKGQTTTPFSHNDLKTGAAICYEGLYGAFYGGFVRGGADLMTIISNDGWWGDTPGYRHLFTISRLRAIETRRAIARSANTGRSGFISARGDIGQTLEWGQRGVITDSVPLNDQLTFYTRWGDYLGRISEYVMLLCMLYYVAYRYKRRNHLVK